jgi:hypothetical protein
MCILRRAPCHNIGEVAIYMYALLDFVQYPLPCLSLYRREETLINSLNRTTFDIKLNGCLILDMLIASLS